MQSDDIRLHAVRTGSGPAVVLLHGFPEFWYSWRHQMRALATAGFAAWAVDLRGYNLSDKPRGRRSYTLPELTSDVAAVVRHTGESRAHIVGHDWGGVIAWAFAAAHPTLLHRLVIVNAPHLALYSREFRRPEQMKRGWYTLLFQVPVLAERLLAARDYAAIRRLFRSTRKLRAALSDEDLERYVEAIARPGALTAALNYYRALLLPQDQRLTSRAFTTAETLIVWGERDRALSPRLLHGVERYAPRARVHRLPGISHWVQNEAPEELSSALVDFLIRPSAMH